MPWWRRHTNEKCTQELWVSNQTMFLVGTGTVPGEVSPNSTMAYWVWFLLHASPFGASWHSEARPKHSLRGVRYLPLYTWLKELELHLEVHFWVSFLETVYSSSFVKHYLHLVAVIRQPRVLFFKDILEIKNNPVRSLDLLLAF